MLENLGLFWFFKMAERGACTYEVDENFPAFFNSLLELFVFLEDRYKYTRDDINLARKGQEQQLILCHLLNHIPPFKSRHHQIYSNQLKSF